MQKSLRWYKNWKCSIKETHLNVWLVKADVLNNFFICHTPRRLSCSPHLDESFPVLPGSGTTWLTGPCWRCCWMCANPPAPASAPTCTEPCLHLLCLTATLGGMWPRSPTQGGAQQAQTPSWWLPVQCSFHKTRLALQCCRENASGPTFSQKILYQNLEKPLCVGYHFGLSSSRTSMGISFALQLWQASLSPGLLKYCQAHVTRIASRASPAPSGTGWLFAQTDWPGLLEFQEPWPRRDKGGWGLGCCSATHVIHWAAFT